MSVPASAVVGVALLVNVTSDVLGVQINPLEIVHLSVTLAPEFSPVTVLTFDPGVVIVAPFGALTKLQAPVPLAGLFAASVKLAVLHRSWFGPAFAIVGVV